MQQGRFTDFSASEFLTSSLSKSFASNSPHTEPQSQRDGHLINKVHREGFAISSPLSEAHQRKTICELDYFARNLDMMYCSPYAFCILY